MTSHLPENQLLRKNATCKRVMSMLAIFDVCGLSKIVRAKCAPRGIIITEVTLLLMDFEAMKGDYNQGIKSKNFCLKSHPTLIKLQIL